MVVRAVAVSFIIASIGSVFFVFLKFNKFESKESNYNVIRHLVPFVFSEKIDPRHVVTVGDQVVSEHVFAFHGKESTQDGFSGVISNIHIDESRSQIVLSPRYELATSIGTKIKLTDYCDSLGSSFKGTAHSLVAPFVKSIDCVANKIVISFTNLPVNIRYLFTLADFSIFFSNLLPLTDKNRNGTGPYYIESLSPNEVRLKRNSNYPKDLIANKIDDVIIQGYAASDAKKLVEDTSSKKNPLIYFYGYSLISDDLDKLRVKGYNIRQMPSEWLIYLGIRDSLSLPQRNWLAKIIDKNRADILEGSLGQEAYSLSPWDRPFGLKKEIYFEAVKNLTTVDVPDQSITLATLDEWLALPVFAATIKLLHEEAKGKLRLTLLSRAEIGKLWDGSFDVILSPLGIAPSDPINNFIFLEEFRPYVTEAELLLASVEKSADKFNTMFLNFELSVLKSRTWIPIGHFPGVVAEASNFHRVGHLSWAWGIQTWTYEIK